MQQNNCRLKTSRRIKFHLTITLSSIFFILNICWSCSRTTCSHETKNIEGILPTVLCGQEQVQVAGTGSEPDCPLLSSDEHTGVGFMGSYEPRTFGADEAGAGAGAGGEGGALCRIQLSASTVTFSMSISPNPGPKPCPPPYHPSPYFCFQLLKPLQLGSLTFLALMFYHPFSSNRALSSSRSALHPPLLWELAQARWCL